MELRQLVDQHRSEVLKIQTSLQTLKKEHASCYDLLLGKLQETSGSGSSATPAIEGGDKPLSENYRGGLVELMQAFVERTSAELLRYRTALEHYDKELSRLQGVKQEHMSCLQSLQQSHVLDSVTPPPSVLARAGGLPSGYLIAQLNELLQYITKNDVRLIEASPSNDNTHVNWIVEKYDRIIASKEEQEHQLSLQLRMFQRDYEKCIDLLNAYLVEPFKSPFPAASSGSVYFSPNDLYAKLSAFIAQYKTERGGSADSLQDGETLAVASLKDELVRVRRDVDTCFELLNSNSPNSASATQPRLRTLREEVQKYIDRVVEESKQWQLIIEDYGVVLEGKERSEGKLSRVLATTLSQQEECLRLLHQANLVSDEELATVNAASSEGGADGDGFATPQGKLHANGARKAILDTPASETSVALSTPGQPHQSTSAPTLAAGRAILSGVRNLLDQHEHLKRSSGSPSSTASGPVTRSRSKALEGEAIRSDYTAVQDLVRNVTESEMSKAATLSRTNGWVKTNKVSHSTGNPLYNDVQHLLQLVAHTESALVSEEYIKCLEIISPHIIDMPNWQHAGDRVQVYGYLLQGVRKLADLLATATAQQHDGPSPSSSSRSRSRTDSGSSSDLKRRLKQAEAEVSRLRPYYDQFQECVHFLSANFRHPIGSDGKEVNERSLLKQLQHLTVEYSNNIDTYHAMVHEYQATAQELEKSTSRAKDLRQRLKDRDASVHKRASEIEDLRREVAALEASRREAEPQVSEMQSELESLRAEVARLKEREKDVSDLQQRIEEAERASRDTATAAAEREDEITAAHSQALDQVAALQEQLYERDAAVAEFELLKDERANCLSLMHASGHDSLAAGDAAPGSLSDALAEFIQRIREEGTSGRDADDARVTSAEAALLEAQQEQATLESQVADLQAQLEVANAEARDRRGSANRQSLNTDHDPRGGLQWTPATTDDLETLAATPERGDADAVVVDDDELVEEAVSPPTVQAEAPARGGARGGPGRSKRGGKRGPGGGGRSQPQAKPSSPPQASPEAGAILDDDDVDVDDDKPDQTVPVSEPAPAATPTQTSTAVTVSPAAIPQISPPHGVRASRHTLADVEAKYKFGQLLGTGSFAEVKFATNIESGTKYAAKIVDKTRWMKYLDCIQREVDILRDIDHENIIHLYDVFDTQTTLYMMTELAPGGDLLEHIEQRGPLNEREARNVMRKMGAALKYLHGRGIVHRDLKPENILLGAGGVNDPNAKLCDFGHSAYLTDRDSGRNTAFGTFIYLAPEVILTKQYDTAMDLWSLGVILYIMFSGQFPFDGQTDAELFEQIVHGRYDFRDPCWRVVSNDARDVVRGLLCINQSQRLTADTLLSHPWVTGEKQQSSSRVGQSRSRPTAPSPAQAQPTTRSHSRGAQPQQQQQRVGPGGFGTPPIHGGHRPPGAPPQREQFGQAPWRGHAPSPMHPSPHGGRMGYAGPPW